MTSSTENTYAIEDVAGFTTVKRGRPDYAKVLSCDESSDELRGLMDTKDDVQTPCSTRYIQLICTEFLRARSVSFLRITDPKSVNSREQKQRLKFLEHEIKRLLQHPSLFPDPSVKARFLALLAIDGSSCFDASCSKFLIEREWRKFDSAWNKTVCRPSYLAESDGWENFLLNRAPGFPYEAKKTVPQSSFQILPLMAHRIARSYEIEEREILEFIHNAPAQFNFSAAQSTMLVNFDNPNPAKDNFPKNLLIQNGNLSALRPNPFPLLRKMNGDQCRSGPDRLDEFSIFTDRLERVRSNINNPPIPRNIFVAQHVRSIRASEKEYNIKYMGESL